MRGGIDRRVAGQRTAGPVNPRFLVVLLHMLQHALGAVLHTFERKEQRLGRHVLELNRRPAFLQLGQTQWQALADFIAQALERLLQGAGELKKIADDDDIAAQSGGVGRRCADGDEPRRAQLQHQRHEHAFLLGGQADEPARALPLLQEIDHRLRIAELVAEDVLLIIAVVLLPLTAAQHFHEGGCFTGGVLVGFQLDDSAAALPGQRGCRRARRGPSRG